MVIQSLATTDRYKNNLIPALALVGTLALVGCIAYRALRPAAPLFTQERRWPPIGPCDTICFDVLTGTIIPGKGRQNRDFFQDSDIVQKEPIVKTQMLEKSLVEVRYTRHNKAILQQQARRACTAATAAMLILDHRKTPDLFQVKTRNLGNASDELRDLEKAQLRAVAVKIQKFSELQNAVKKHGSVITGIGGEIGSHSIVVDAISTDTVRLRDPYHGWEITVSKDAFTEKWDGDQIKSIVYVSKH